MAIVTYFEKYGHTSPPDVSWISKGNHFIHMTSYKYLFDIVCPLGSQGGQTFLTLCDTGAEGVAIPQKPRDILNGQPTRKK